MFFGKKSTIGEAEVLITEFNSETEKIRQAGSMDGLHYTDSVELIKELKRSGKYEKVERL